MGGDLNDTISEKKGKPLRIDEERVSWASDDVSLPLLDARMSYVPEKLLKAGD